MLGSRFGKDIKLVLLFTLVSVGCSETPRGGPREKTFPIFGVVKVDGEPAEGLHVTCHPNPPFSEVRSTFGAVTNADGKFSFSTYVLNDGLPAGPYSLTFRWNEPGLGDRVDRLGNAYSDPSKTQHQVSVGVGKDQDLGIIELNSAKPTRS